MENQTKSGLKAKRRFFIETMLIAFIIASPFIFKLHEYFPSEPDAKFSFLGIEITKHGFHDLSIFAWFLIGKLIPLLLLTIWFFTCKHWWYHILLIPVCMYAFQIFEVLYSQDDFIDTENILWILPICMLVIPFVYLVRLKLFDKYVHGIDLAALNAELEYYKEKESKSINLSNQVDNENYSIPEVDLSDETPKKTLQQIFSGLRVSLRSLF